MTCRKVSLLAASSWHGILKMEFHVERTHTFYRVERRVQRRRYERPTELRRPAAGAILAAR
jgi:hypothetical protein